MFSVSFVSLFVGWLDVNMQIRVLPQVTLPERALAPTGGLAFSFEVDEAA